MTAQLENLGQQLSISLIHEGINNQQFQRLVTLNLNNIAVVAAFSWANVDDRFFSQLLLNANTIPIGKFLFTDPSHAHRLNNMQIKQISLQQIQTLKLQQMLAASGHAPTQSFWQRSSIFAYRHEQLHLVEILLPELANFLTTDHKTSTIR